MLRSGVLSIQPRLEGSAGTFKALRLIKSGQSVWRSSRLNVSNFSLDGDEGLVENRSLTSLNWLGQLLLRHLSLLVGGDHEVVLGLTAHLL